MTEYEVVLPPRLYQAACLLSKGLSDREVADKMIVSLHTARQFSRLIRLRLGITGMTHTQVVLAVRELFHDNLIVQSNKLEVNK